jgi:hypothetical protein
LSVLSFTLTAVSMSACAIPGSAGLISRVSNCANMEARELLLRKRDPRCPEGK